MDKVKTENFFSGLTDLCNNKNDSVSIDDVHKVLFSQCEDKLDSSSTKKPANLALFLTSEDLLSNYRIRQFFPDDHPNLSIIAKLATVIPIHAVLCVRSQNAYIEACYLQQIHLGGTDCFDDYYNEIKDRNDSLNWFHLAERILSQVPFKELTVIPYEFIKDDSLGYIEEIINPQLSLSNEPIIETLPKVSSGRGNENRSYSDIALNIALKANKLLTSQDDKVKLRKFLQNNFSNKTHSRAQLLDPQQSLEVIKAYSASNKLLFEKFISIKYRSHLKHYTNEFN